MPNKKVSPRKSKKNSKSAPIQLARGHFKFGGVLLLSIMAALVVFGVAYQLMTQAATTYTAFVGVGGKCLDNNRQIKANGNRIQIYTCNTSTAQGWKVNSNGTITNVNGYCLDARGSGNASVPVLLQQCIANANDLNAASQLWTVQATSAIAGTIVNRKSGWCLEDAGAVIANLNPVQIAPCNASSAAQKWTSKSILVTTPGTSGGGTALEPSGQAMPGTVAGWKRIFADDFAGTVPKGAFSDCDHGTNGSQPYCNGLKKYPSYFANWWAYPNTWPDTAKSGADGNKGAPYGGVYHPEDTVSVSGGAMHIRMYRPKTGGNNHVATVVPRKCMAHKYGRYVERFKVVSGGPGFKSAHLFYDGGFEIDYPENDYGAHISAYTHPGEANFGTSAKWTSWHTTAIEWTPGKLKFYMDGKLIGTTTKKVPNIKMSWILQNESSIMGPYAKNGAVAQLDLDWVACYAQG